MHAAQVLTSNVQIPSALPTTAAMLMRQAMSQINNAHYRQLSCLLWACARLKIRHNDLSPGCEEAILNKLVADETLADMQGGAMVL